MKRIIIIASALMAFASFGGQQNQVACAITNNMQASDAICRYQLEVYRVIANRIKREQYQMAERLRLEIERAERDRKTNPMTEYKKRKNETYKRMSLTR